MDNNIESMDNEDLLLDYEPEGLDNIAEPFKLNCYFYRSQNKRINSKNQGLLFGNGYKNIVFLHKNEYIILEGAISESELQKDPNINSSESATFLYKKIRQLQIEGTAEFLNEDEWFVSIGNPATKDNIKKMYWVSKFNPQYYYEEDEKGKGYDGPKIITKQLTDITLSDQNFFINATGSLIEIVLLDIDMKQLLDSELTSFKIKAPRSFLPSTIKTKVIQDGNIRDLNTFSQDKIMFPLRIEPTTVDKSSNFLIPSWTKNNLRFRDIANFGNLGLTTNADFYNNFAVQISSGTTIDINNGIFNYHLIEGWYTENNNPNANRKWTERFDIFNYYNATRISWQTGSGWTHTYALGHDLGSGVEGKYIHMSFTKLGSTIRYIDQFNQQHTLPFCYISKGYVRFKLTNAKHETSTELKFPELLNFNTSNLTITGQRGLKNFEVYIHNSKTDNTYSLVLSLGSGIGMDMNLDIILEPDKKDLQIITAGTISENLIGDFIKVLISLNDAYFLGFPNSQFDTNGTDPKNNIAVMKNFVINNDSSIEKAMNNIIKRFMSLNKVLLSPLNSSSQAINFKEKFQSAISFIFSLGDRLQTDWTLKDGNAKIYNPFYIDLYSTSAPIQSSQIPSMMKNLIGGMDFNDNTAYYLTDLKGSAGSEYFNWTPQVSPDDPNIYYIKDVTPIVSSLSKSKFIFDLTLKSDYAYRELNERADEKLLNTNPSLIDISKEEYQKYLCYIPLTQDQIEPFLGLMGQYDGSGYVNRVDIRKKLLPFGDFCEFEIGFSKEDVVETINQLEISGFFGGIMILTLIFTNLSGNIIEIPIETTILNEIDESISRTTFIL